MGSSSNESSPSSSASTDAPSPLLAADPEDASPISKNSSEPTIASPDAVAAFVPPAKNRLNATQEQADSSLRSLLSDPITGELMEDATLLPCGHSFGSGGLRQVLEAKACVTCGRPVSQRTLTPNLALQAVIKAFRWEEKDRRALSRKRQRDRFIQDHTAITDHADLETPSLRGSQFSFTVGDKVIIKGNKRTPDRLVNHEAVITAQCLNGWFMVKTLDNGEAVKLQHRSLIKVEG